MMFVNVVKNEVQSTLLCFVYLCKTNVFIVIHCGSDISTFCLFFVKVVLRDLYSLELRELWPCMVNWTEA